MLGIEYGGSATLKTRRIASVRQDGANLLCEDATKTGQGAIYVFLRNEPTEFSPQNGIYTTGQQVVTQIKTSKKRWVRFGKRTHREGIFEGKFDGQATFGGLFRLRRGSLFLPEGVLISIDVLLRGGGPIEVLRHGLLTELEDVLGSVEPSGDGPADAIVQRATGRFPEFEPRAVAGRFVIILHRVVEAAGGADDGERAVLEGVNLVETAGLVQRWHEEKSQPASMRWLSSGENPMCAPTRPDTPRRHSERSFRCPYRRCRAPRIA